MCGVVDPLESRRLLSTVKIMPLGDSITESSAPRYSYRMWLQKSLQRHGYGPVDFVGSMHGQLGNENGTYQFDQDHEGHAGWTANRVLANVDTFMKDAAPDVVLLHIGTNDLRRHQSPQSTIIEIRRIISRLRAANEHVTVLLSTLIPNHYDPKPRLELNEQIAGLARSQDRRDSRVMLVDQAAGFNYVTDTHDGLHPNVAGERKMAAKFFAAVKSFVPRKSALTGSTRAAATPQKLRGIDLDSLLSQG